jgi:hypothetical protein
MRGLGVILWGFVLMTLLTNSLVVPRVVYGIAVAVGLYIGVRRWREQNR